jgi:hypothetical protein
MVLANHWESKNEKVDLLTIKSILIGDSAIE